MEKEKLMDTVKKGVCLTHNDKFHADDVLSACLLRLINPKMKVLRASSVPENFDGLVFDIGSGDYDHHDRDNKVRKNGIHYASFGLLWKDLSYLFMDKRHTEWFDDVFVSEIDRCDTTPRINLLSSSIESFNPLWNTKEDSDSFFETTVKTFTPCLKTVLSFYQKNAFVPHGCPDIVSNAKAVLSSLIKERTGHKANVSLPLNDFWYEEGFVLTPEENPDVFWNTFLKQINRGYGFNSTSPFIMFMYPLSGPEQKGLLLEIIKRKLAYTNSMSEAERDCEQKYLSSERKDVLVFDRYTPTDYLAENCEDVKAVIYPNERGSFSLLCMNMSRREKTEKRIPQKEKTRRFLFPEKVRGEKEAVLRDMYKGIFFVHPSGYIASGDTVEDLLNFFDSVK